MPSRWLARLDALFGYEPGSSAPPPEYIQRGRRSYLAWADALDGRGDYRPWPRPEPRPPLEARPTRLSVSSIEQWRRDPYGLYARRILGLEALDPLEAGAGRRRARLGAARCARRVPEGLSLRRCCRPTRIGAVRGAGREASRPLLAAPAERAFWWPRFQRLARWFVATENARRARRHQAAGERNQRRARPSDRWPAAAHRSARRPHRRDRARRLGDHRLQDRPRALAQGARRPVRAAAAARGGDGRARRLRRHQGHGDAPCISPIGRPTAWATAARSARSRTARRWCRRCWRWSRKMVEHFANPGDALRRPALAGIHPALQRLRPSRARRRMVDGGRRRGMSDVLDALAAARPRRSGARRRPAIRPGWRPMPAPARPRC